MTPVEYPLGLLRTSRSETPGRPTMPARTIERVRLRLAFALLAACLVCMSAGCGPSERASDAAVVAERFHPAIGQRDG